ncbi:formyltransferase family protein [Streptomyces sp. NBC_01077]|uniref:formyltransferase family protein n=1 Tax=Streptomyces sp. NBC_01077 TaxID=2903746 RepID=UPI00386BF6AB|nr:formyltransferase family protein [Streptomyces sp. NBC_01077]
MLFIGDTSHWSRLAASHLRDVFGHVSVLLWDYGDPPPRLPEEWNGDHIFCFKADLLLKPETLARAAVSALNFHPATPQFRGVGGYDFVLRDGGAEFGATSHHIVPRIDAGPIVKVSRFPIARGENAASLSARTAAHCLVLFYEVIGMIAQGRDLPVSDEQWGERLYTRAMLRRLHTTLGRQ